MGRINHAPRKARLPLQPRSFDDLTATLTNDEICRGHFLMRLLQPGFVGKPQWQFTPADFRAVRQLMQTAIDCPQG